MGGSDSLEDELLLVVYMRGIDVVLLDLTLQELVKIDRKDLEASRVGQGVRDARMSIQEARGLGTSPDIILAPRVQESLGLEHIEHPLFEQLASSTSRVSLSHTPRRPSQLSV
jgi:hypothetical protein